MCFNGAMEEIKDILTKYKGDKSLQAMADAISETWFDDAVPSPGLGSFFLIRADGCGPGGLGDGIGGAERINADPGACPRRNPPGEAPTAPSPQCPW